jgi:OOP family OmpA-OmpF porin
MSDLANDKDGGDPIPENPLRQDSSLEELRRLLLQPLQHQISRLVQRLDDPRQRAKDVSRILPEAIALRSVLDNKVDVALEPVTEKAIISSIRKNRRVFAEALAPIMGPAIRRSISSAIQKMIQSFNQVLEHSVSAQGFKWRLEALRTRRPFAEVVLLHTLVYQVEQVFLIHRNTGLLLQNVVSKSITAQDPDLVSGMITAITDFVHDSFGGDQSESLEVLRVGERSVVIEQGHQVILAAVVRGTPPQDYRDVLQDALNDIQFGYSDQLSEFEGDASAFEAVGSILENCVQVQFEKKAPKRNIFPIVIAGIFFLLIAFGVYTLYAKNQRWSLFMEHLHREPGIIVTHSGKRSGKFTIFGLRDPLSSDPMTILESAGLDRHNVEFHLEPFHSTHSEFALERIRVIFNPPDSVDIDFNAGRLTLNGSAFHQWLVETEKLAQVLPWIKTVQATHVTDIEALLKPPETVKMRLEGRSLLLAGTAPHQWIVTTRNRVQSMPGIVSLDEKQLIDTDRDNFEAARHALEKQILFFKAGGSELETGQTEVLNMVLQTAEGLMASAEGFQQSFRIDIIGHADNSGSEEMNMKVSRERAETIRNYLTARGIAGDRLTVVGAGARMPVRQGIELARSYSNRNVTFRVVVPPE